MPAAEDVRDDVPATPAKHRRVCSVSVDLDPLRCYYRIYALGKAPGPGLADVVLRRAVPRFLDVFARNRVQATFFVVASDLEASGAAGKAARALVRDMLAAGHEVASHSYEHAYEMARWPATRAHHEIRRAHEFLGDAAGAAPLGFRAPGYDLSAAMLDALAAHGYLYDSSIFPAPGYYALKAVAMAALRLAGRPSGAVMTNPRALTAPTEPYRPSARAPWRRGQSPLVELPVAVTPGWRVPAIGTSLLLAPVALRSRWLDDMLARRFFNFELHGIDLIDADKDGIPAELVARQADLRVSLEAKQRAFEATLGRLQLDYRFETLATVARRVQREGVAA
jgi:peptidoglycan-N-acetylglucosamine deacetylase